MKNNKDIEKSYINKKRIEYFTENQKTNQFEMHHSCLFNGYSEEDMKNGSKYGAQNPLLSLKTLIDFYIVPLLQNDLKENIDENKMAVLSPSYPGYG